MGSITFQLSGREPKEVDAETESVYQLMKVEKKIMNFVPKIIAGWGGGFVLGAYFHLVIGRRKEVKMQFRRDFYVKFSSPQISDRFFFKLCVIVKVPKRVEVFMIFRTFCMILKLGLKTLMGLVDPHFRTRNSRKFSRIILHLEYFFQIF